MPRRPRLEASGALHHVVVQAASDCRIVADDTDRLRLLDELRAVVTGCGWRCGAYLRCAALYTVLNPVAAGICPHPSHFPWSSYRETVGVGPGSGLLAPKLILQTLADDPGEARLRYREIVDDAVVRLGRRRTDELWWRSVERAALATRETG